MDKLIDKIFSKAFFLMVVKSRDCWAKLTLYNTKNISPIQFDRLCRQQNKFDFKFELCFGMSRKHCGKRRKCRLLAFSCFHTIFS